MENVGNLLGAAWNKYIQAAVGPLHKLTWETFSLFLILLLSACLVALWIVRITWRFSKPALKDVRVKRAAHTYKEHLRVSFNAYKAFHGRALNLPIKSDAVQGDRLRDASRYYVVTIVEHGKVLPLFSKEMKLQFASGRFSVQDGAVQFDEESLNAVRLGNSSEADDEDGSDIVGTYDVFIRRVEWYDVRHWLTHPNREIRIIIWVTIITTLLPMLKDFLFG